MYKFSKDGTKIMLVEDEGRSIDTGTVDKDGKPIVITTPVMVLKSEAPTQQFLDNLQSEIDDLDKRIALLIVQRTAKIAEQKAILADIPEIPIEIKPDIVVSDVAVIPK